jgi:hypothetical protein
MGVAHPYVAVCSPSPIRSSTAKAAATTARPKSSSPAAGDTATGGLLVVAPRGLRSKGQTARRPPRRGPAYVDSRHGRRPPPARPCASSRRPRPDVHAAGGPLANSCAAGPALLLAPPGETLQRRCVEKKIGVERCKK